MFNKPSLFKAILSRVQSPSWLRRVLGPATCVCVEAKVHEGSRPGFAALRRVSEQVGDYNRHMAHKESGEIMDRSAQTHAYAIVIPLKNREPREQTSVVVTAHPCSLYVTPSLLSAGLPPVGSPI